MRRGWGWRSWVEDGLNFILEFFVIESTAWFTEYIWYCDLLDLGVLLSLLKKKVGCNLNTD